MTLRSLLQASTASSLVLLSVGVASAPAFAQQGAAVGLEEITVTARKVEESLMQVPLAISALSSADIQNAGIMDLNDLAKFTPGLVDTPGMQAGLSPEPFRRNTTRLTFRGLSTDPGLAFIDGAPYGGTETPDVTDVARIEVLKGPQSVYFGRSTFSGAVNYVSKEPSADGFHGRVSGDLSSYGGNDVHASIEGPISDKLAFRVSGRHYGTDGQYENPLEGGRLGEQSTNSFSVNLVARPSDALKISAFYNWSLDEDGEPAEGILLARTLSVSPSNPALEVTSPTGGELNCNTGGTGGLYYCGGLPSLRNLVRNDPLFISVDNKLDPLTVLRLITNAPLPVAAANNAVETYPEGFDPHWLKHFGYKALTQTGHLKADYETQSGWTLSSIVAWDRTKTEQISDYVFRDASELPNPFYVSPTATPLLPVDNLHVAAPTTITTDYSGEVRITSPAKAALRGSFGASYLRISTPVGANDGYGHSGSIITSVTSNLSKTPAIFGGLYYDILSQLTLSAEARYQWDNINQAGLFPVPLVNQSHTYTSFSPRVSLDYKFADNSLAYALFSQGYKPGGFNTILLTNPPQVVAQLQAAGIQLAYAQEKLTNYEIGIKSTWLDNRLQTIIDAYYDKWNNGQSSQTFYVTLPGGTYEAVSGTINTGQVHLSGVEAEAHYAATNHLLLSGSLAYMHNIMTNYQDFSKGLQVYGSTNADGYSLPAAPQWTFSLSPQYTDHLMGDWDWFARVDWTYRSRIFIDTHDIAWLDPLSLVNLRFGVARDKLRVEAYANNLFNNTTIQSAGVSMDLVNQNITANGIRVAAPSKRILGLKASYDF